MKSKIIIGSIFLFCVFVIGQKGFCQTSLNRIEIKLVNESELKYAYLADFEDKKLYSAPLDGKTFVFNIKKAKDLHLMQLLLLEDKISNYASFDSVAKEKPDWIRLIAIEDTKLLIYWNAKDNAVVKEGKYNKDLHDMNEASITGDYHSFFLNNSDSPVALIFLTALHKYNKRGPLYKPIDIQFFFDLLSYKVRNSPDGLAFKKEINEK